MWVGNKTKTALALVSMRLFGSLSACLSMGRIMKRRPPGWSATSWNQFLRLCRLCASLSVSTSKVQEHVCISGFHLLCATRFADFEAVELAT